MTLVYGFWNNKGGTGKTTLCFQSITTYAHRWPKRRVLAIDVCPQANLSELLFGGLANRGSDVLLARQGEATRRTIGGYFEQRLPTPYQAPVINPDAYISHPADYNAFIPSNIDLIAGDPLLELQSNAMFTLANTNLPIGNAWLGIVDWISDLIASTDDRYDAIFIDANPSFSIYTQIALSCTNRLVLPVMADDSSRRAIQNAFSLIYGLRLPSPVYATYAFSTRLLEANRELPKVHIIAKNRLTQYMGPASAYSAVLKSIDTDVEALMGSQREMFSVGTAGEAIVDIRDFQTAGVVAHARGCPFYAQSPGRIDILGRRIQVNRDSLDNCVDAIDELVDEL